MNDDREQPVGKKGLADSLLAIDSRMAGSLAEGREVAEKVLRRDRRRVRILTWVAVGLFLLTVLGIGWSAFFFQVKIQPAMTKMRQDLSLLSQELTKEIPQPAKPDVQHLTAHVALIQGHYFLITQTIFFWGTLALLAITLAAAFSTVVLITASRRATFRQIQANLLLLSEKFDALQSSIREKGDLRDV